MGWISPDGNTIIFRPNDGSTFFRTLDVNSGRSWNWPSEAEALHPYNYPSLGLLSPSLLGCSGNINGRPTFQLRRVADSSLVQTFKGRIGGDPFDYQGRLIDAGKRLCLVNATTFSVWDVNSGQLNREVALRASASYALNTLRLYVISLDGQKVFGCQTNEMKIWNTRTGQQIGSWNAGAPKAAWGFAGFSPDARLVVFGPPSKFPWRNWRILDVSTGKLGWQYTSNYPLPLSDDGQQVAVPLAKGCELRSAATGKVIKHLRLPRLGDGNILRFNSDSIYTLNARFGVQRWRIR